jgi:hypothetical protein
MKFQKCLSVFSLISALSLISFNCLFSAYCIPLSILCSLSISSNTNPSFPSLTYYSYPLSLSTYCSSSYSILSILLLYWTLLHLYLPILYSLLHALDSLLPPSIQLSYRNALNTRMLPSLANHSMPLIASLSLSHTASSPTSSLWIWHHQTSSLTDSSIHSANSQILWVYSLTLSFYHILLKVQYTSA